MDWTTTAWTPQGSDSPRGDAVDALVAGLRPGERVVAAFSTTRFEMAGFVGKLATVVLTNSSMLVAKDKLFGRPKTNLTVELSSITSCGYGPLLGVGPTWEVSFASRRGPGTIYFQDPSNAERFESELRAAVSQALGDEADPDLAELHRALELTRGQPDGDEGKLMQPDQVTAEARRIREQYLAGSYQFVWDRRVQLGYGTSSDGVAESDSFWLNACAALAALKLGLKEHPMVAMCCGVAESHADRSDPEQRAAVEEFNRLFFG